eukprot:1547070-Pyramimonas_sp.AAC.1
MYTRTSQTVEHAHAHFREGGTLSQRTESTGSKLSRKHQGTRKKGGCKSGSRQATTGHRYRFVCT